MEDRKDMNPEHRKAPRIYLLNFTDYLVSIEWDSLRIESSLGNISETGMCCVFSEKNLIQKGDRISGNILHNDLHEKIEYTGKVIWKEEYEIQSKQYIAMGVQFMESIELPDHLFALSLLSVD
jgi:hypothetical protein